VCFENRENGATSNNFMEEDFRNFYSAATTIPTSLANLYSTPPRSPFSVRTHPLPSVQRQVRKMALELVGRFKRRPIKMWDHARNVGVFVTLSNADPSNFPRPTAQFISPLHAAKHPMLCRTERLMVLMKFKRSYFV
jgi:hypothetical protein